MATSKSTKTKKTTKAEVKKKPVIKKKSVLADAIISAEDEADFFIQQKPNYFKLSMWEFKFAFMSLWKGIKQLFKK